MLPGELVTAVAERIPIVRRAGRQPRLRLDRRALALGRLGGLRHALPRRGERRAAGRRAASRESRAAAGRPRGQRREPRRARHPRAARWTSCAPRSTSARRRRAGRASTSRPTATPACPSYESWWDVPVAEVADEPSCARRARPTSEARRASAPRSAGTAAAARADERAARQQAAARARRQRSSVTPERAGLELRRLRGAAAGRGARRTRETGDRELCVVVIAGPRHASANGARRARRPLRGRPGRGVLPARLDGRGCAAAAEIGLCWAPGAPGGAAGAPAARARRSRPRPAAAGR